MAAGLTYEQVMALGKGDEPPHEGSVSGEGLTYEQVMALGDGEDKPPVSDFVKGVGNVAALGDMLLNMPSDVLGFSANLGARVGGFIAGDSRRKSAQAAQRIQGEAQDLAGKVGLVRDPLKKLMGLAGVGQGYKQSAVSSVMEKFDTGVKQFGKFVEKKTGGLLYEEDMQDLIGETLLFGGPHAAVSLAKGGLAKLAGTDKGLSGLKTPVDESPPESPGPIDFERKLDPSEAGVKSKSGKTRKEGQPYESLSNIPPEERLAILKRLDSEANGIVSQLKAIEPDESGMPTREQLVLEARLKNISETQRTIREVPPSSPLARETVYGREFGEFPEGKDPGLAEPNVQPGLDPSQFLAESRSQPLIDRIKAERQAQVESGFRSKEAEMDQAWQEHKAAQAREADLTAREDQYADVQDRFDRQRVVNQKGEIDQDLFNKMGLAAAGTVAGLYAYARPDQQKEIAASVAAIGGVIASRGKLPAGLPEGSLGKLLSEGKYTLKTLDRLPQNKTEFNIEQVRQELNKSGTSIAEKVVLEPILLEASTRLGGKVSASALVSEFRKATGEHTLTPSFTHKFADHGLPNLGRLAGYEGAKTIVWRFPESMHVSTQNHFGDPRYYGHTREYRVNGVDHVVEIQSDLAQNVRKPLSDEARKTVYEELKGLEISPKRPDPGLNVEQKKRWQELRMSLIKDDTSRVVAEGRPGLVSGKADFASLTLAVKNAPNRLIREKLGEAAARGAESVRFATADTVAKVEGWTPDTNPGHQSLYARYAKETTSYLKSLGGKEVIDAQGNTWLEVPTGVKGSDVEIRSLNERLATDKEAFAKLHARYLDYESMGKAPETLRALESRMQEHVTNIDRSEARLAELEKKPIADTNELRPFGGRSDGFGGPIHMYGKADSDLLVKLGLGTAGALTGAYLSGDEKIAGIALGTIAALSSPAAIRAIARAHSPQHALGQAARISLALGAGTYLGNKIEHPVEGALLAMGLVWGRKMLPEVRKNIGDSFMNLRNGNLQVHENMLSNLKRDAESMMPDKARREVVTEMAVEKRNAGWTPEESNMMRAYDQILKETGHKAMDAGILRSMRENYITSIVERTPEVTDLSLKKLIGDLFDSPASTTNVGSGKRFTMERKYDTWQDLNKALEGTGLRLKTKDIVEIADYYLRAMHKSIEDKIMTDSIKNSVDPDGAPNAVRANKRGELPPGYEKIDSPFFKGRGKQSDWGVRSDIAPALKILLEHSEPWLVTKAMYAVSQAIKRLNVFGSLFHAKSLAEVYILGMGRTIVPTTAHALKATATYVGSLGSRKLEAKSPIGIAIEKFRDGSIKETTDALIRNGLRFGVPEDVSQTIIGSTGKLIDAKTGTTYGTAVTDKIDVVNKHTDAVTWGYALTGVQASVALKEFERITLNNAELHAKDPARYPLKSVDEVAAEVARFSNDISGSPDWFRIATEAKTELGRSVALAFASDTGRRIAQIILFAPSWNLTTLRAAFKSFGESETGFRGLLKPTNATDLYRRYALRSLFYWITGLNVIQYSLTGKPIWENKDPTRLEFGDGTSIQIGKHSTEAVHAVKDPTGFALNKIGFLPRAAVDTALAHSGKGPLINQGPTAYTLERVLPFTVRPFVDPNLTVPQSAGRAVMGAAGMPILGYNQEQKLAMRAKTLQQHYDRQAKGR